MNQKRVFNCIHFSCLAFFGDILVGIDFGIVQTHKKA